MKYNIIGLGGCGINNLKRYLANGYFTQDFNMLGLDTSDRNIFDTDKVIFERVPGTQGSGSDQSLNADKYPDFLKRIISQYEIEGLVILLYSGSGGTGSSMGPTLHEMLVERGVKVVSVVVGDMADVNRGTNTVRTLLNLNAITELGYPALYAYYQNGKVPQGSIDEDISGFIDTARVVLSDENARIDTMDIHNFFFYNSVVKATPVLSRIEFVSDKNLPEYKKNAVAALSLFDNEDNIMTVVDNLLYSKEGIFKPEFKNTQYASITAILDHGDSLRQLENLLSEQRVHNAETNDRFQSTSETVATKLPKSEGRGFKNFDI